MKVSQVKSVTHKKVSHMKVSHVKVSHMKVSHMRVSHMKVSRMTSVICSIFFLFLSTHTHTHGSVTHESVRMKVADFFNDFEKSLI